MLVINNLTKPGGIKRVELRSYMVRVVLVDGTERVFKDEGPRHVEQADYGYLDSVADQRRDGH